MEQAVWIWCFGDFELHHHKKVCMRREERGHRYPAPWRVYDCNRQVRFRRTYTLQQAETVTFAFDGVGYVEVEYRRYPAGVPVPLPAGTFDILVCVMNETGIPAVFCDGKCVRTDGSWEVTTFDQKWAPAAHWNLSDPSVKPSDFELPTEREDVVSSEPVDGGMLYDFGKETYIRLVTKGLDAGQELRLCYGESREEAMDFSFAVISDRLVAASDTHTFPARACHFVRIIGKQPTEVFGLHEYLPLDWQAKFETSDREIADIYRIADRTFRLNSLMFYQDGIKRDRWVWSGDAYQSYFFNYYSCFDPEIIQRTVLALRGGDPIASHLNTIVDYSLYWLASLGDYRRFTGDETFLARLYPRALGLLQYCETFENAEGLVEGREGLDWTFIDWADMDKTGALAAMQMLYCKACEAMAECAERVGDTANAARYTAKARVLRDSFDGVFWNAEKGAYVTTVHGKVPSNEVRRHANVFAVLFGFADAEKSKSILERVLLNPEIPAITTPFFQIFEMEALCRLGRQDLVTERMRAYFGGMVREGATTFWEEYDPTVPGKDQLGMYGWKFDKSLCHAWGAGPLYLLGRYYVGVEPTADGYETFAVCPNAGGIADFDATVPVKGGTVHVRLANGHAEITATRAGGTAVFGGKRVALPAGQTVTL